MEVSDYSLVGGFDGGLDGDLDDGHGGGLSGCLGDGLGTNSLLSKLHWYWISIRGSSLV